MFLSVSSQSIRRKMKKKDKLLQQPETFGHRFSTSVLVIVENENFSAFTKETMLFQEKSLFLLLVKKKP